MEKKMDMVVYTSHYSYCRKDKIGGLWSSLAWAKSDILSQKKQNKKKAEIKKLKAWLKW
jgi:hypothetical protein